MSKWIELGPTTDFPANAATQFKAEGIPLVVFNIEGAYMAIANVCPHAGLPLAEGELCGKVLTCPFHGYTYNVETGKNVDFPSDEPVRTFPVRISVEGKLEIDLQGKCA